jgi:hypothetical protein
MTGNPVRFYVVTEKISSYQSGLYIIVNIQNLNEYEL